MQPNRKRSGDTGRILDLADQEIDKKHRERGEHKGDQRISGENQKGRGQMAGRLQNQRLPKLHESEKRKAVDKNQEQND